MPDSLSFQPQPGLVTQLSISKHNPHRHNFICTDLKRGNVARRPPGSVYLLPGDRRRLWVKQIAVPSAGVS